MAQNEILTLSRCLITRELVENIGSFPHLRLSVMMKEQEAACLKYVEKDLARCEKCTGLCEAPLTTGENLAKVVMDGLQRLNLPINGVAWPSIR